ncbi:hypothetical protein PK35_14715 [Tamlana nanhaiensis]|uniref:DinB-like domain-containing protein n=1 Tax=Neotamlana nanhaiensis TaxID=1382798 RepID=A0A0D7VWZ7_9FLAO|nr:DinB family protein [Tamlana nanhaiensis]KJD31361.1 hypothetical protein PK35_14715 [Tamlana nanhaiensis]
MKKSQINPMPKFFDRYIKLVREDDLLLALTNSLSVLNELDLALYNTIADKRYQPEKWTVKEVIQHVIDNERIQAYRALRFARFDTTVLSGYDEKVLAHHNNANKRTIDDLLNELKLVRQTSIYLFESFDDDGVKNLGDCFNVKINALALGFVIVGHQMHHLNIINERYVPLVNPRH